MARKHRRNPTELRGRKYNYCIYAFNNATGRREKIDTASSEKEADYMARNYRSAFGKGFYIWYQRHE